MALWVIRAGRDGDQEQVALQENVVCHGWNELPDYSKTKSRGDLGEIYRKTYPTETEKQIIARLGQVWRFARDISKGDIVALPLKKEASFQFGRVVGDYQYRVLAPNVKHVRSVEWLKKIPRSEIPVDILMMMNAALTVFRLSRNSADLRVDEILKGLKPSLPMMESAQIIETEDETPEEVNLESAARDEVIKFIQDRFKGHALARLVDSVLRAQGYKTVVSPPGPDGGVDILAGCGPLGFDEPRLCVQVKSGSGTEGQKTYNELLGVVSKFASQQGLLVSWGGFTTPVRNDARKDFFRIRLWDQGDLVDAILNNYVSLDDEVKAELPLKRIWILVKDEDE